MKQHLLLTTLLILGLGITIHAQNTGIGTITPDPDAALEVSATDKGLLLPRIALTGTAAAAPLSTHVAGMTIYNTATAADVTPGYYYNDGTQWVRIAEAGADINTLLSLDPVTGVLTYTNEDNDNPPVDLTAIEPWFGTDNNAGATENTEDIYTMGGVAIGKDSFDRWGPLEIENNAPNGSANITLTGNHASHIVIEAYRNSPWTHAAFRAWAGRGTKDAPAALNAGDGLLYLDAQGHNGTALGGISAAIRYIAAENFTPTANGTHMQFLTTDTGSTSAAERMRIAANGNVGIGTTTPRAGLEVSKSNVIPRTTIPPLSDLPSVATADNYSLMLSNSDNKTIGLVSGFLNVSNTYHTYFQARSFSNPLAYNLLLNPLGGNIGIGTTTPNEKLEVNGKVRVSDLTGADLATDVIVTANATTGELKEGGTLASITAAAADGDAWGVTGEDIASAITRTGDVTLNGGDLTLSKGNNVFLNMVRPGVGNDFRFHSEGGFLRLQSGTDDSNYPNDIISVNGSNLNVGINTTTPGAKLDVRNSGTEDILNLRDGTTEIMTVLDGGNVGIGVTNPSVKLQVNATAEGAVRIVDGSQGNNKILVTDNNGVGKWRTIGPVYHTNTIPTVNVGNTIGNSGNTLRALSDPDLIVLPTLDVSKGQVYRVDYKFTLRATANSVSNYLSFYMTIPGATATGPWFGYREMTHAIPALQAGERYTISGTYYLGGGFGNGQYLPTTDPVGLSFWSNDAGSPGGTYTYEIDRHANAGGNKLTISVERPGF